jgi:hypothetical protein
MHGFHNGNEQPCKQCEDEGVRVNWIYLFFAISASWIRTG